MQQPVLTMGFRVWHVVFRSGSIARGNRRRRTFSPAAPALVVLPTFASQVSNEPFTLLEYQNVAKSHLLKGAYPPPDPLGEKGMKRGLGVNTTHGHATTSRPSLAGGQQSQRPRRRAREQAKGTTWELPGPWGPGPRILPPCVTNWKKRMHDST